MLHVSEYPLPGVDDCIFLINNIIKGKLHSPRLWSYGKPWYVRYADCRCTHFSWFTHPDDYPKIKSPGYQGHRLLTWFNYLIYIQIIHNRSGFGNICLLTADMRNFQNLKHGVVIYLDDNLHNYIRRSIISLIKLNLLSMPWWVTSWYFRQCRSVMLVRRPRSPTKLSLAGYNREASMKTGKSCKSGWLTMDYNCVDIKRVSEFRM